LGVVAHADPAAAHRVRGATVLVGLGALLPAIPSGPLARVLPKLLTRGMEASAQRRACRTACSPSAHPPRIDAPELRISLSTSSYRSRNRVTGSGFCTRNRVPGSSGDIFIVDCGSGGASYCEPAVQGTTSRRPRVTRPSPAVEQGDRFTAVPATLVGTRSRGSVTFAEEPVASSSRRPDRSRVRNTATVWGGTGFGDVWRVARRPKCGDRRSRSLNWLRRRWVSAAE